MHPQTHKPTERLGMSSTDTPFAKDAARRAANETGAAKNSVYAALHEEAEE